MKSFKTLLLLGGIFFFVSCGSDGDCTVEDWVGTYTLVPGTEDCPDENIELNSSITISAGSEANTINFDGIEAEISGCSLEYSEPFFGISGSADLDGDDITVSVLGCTGTFTRQ